MSAEEGAVAATVTPSRLQSLAQALEAAVPDKLTVNITRINEIDSECAADDLLLVAQVLRDAPALKFETVADVCGIDYLSFGHDEWKTASATHSGFSRGVIRGTRHHEAREVEVERVPTGRRFAVVYHLLSVSLNQRARLKVFCPDDEQPMVDSVTDIWAGANWFERECFDLYGILFRGHPDLRRLLTDYGFIGHPFRKDFPITGNVEVRYDPQKGRVIYQPVSIEPRVLVPKVIRHDNRYDPLLTNAPPSELKPELPPHG